MSRAYGAKVPRGWSKADLGDRLPNVRFHLCFPRMQSWTNSFMPPAPVAVRVVSPRCLASCLHRSCLASNIPGCSRMTQVRRSGPAGIALQFSANAVDENAAEQAINAEMILSVGIIGLVSISASPNGFPVYKKQAPKSRLLATFLKVRAGLLRIPLKSAVGQSRRFCRRPVTSGQPQ